MSREQSSTSRTRRGDRANSSRAGGRRHRSGARRERLPMGDPSVFERIVAAASELLERDGVMKLTVGEIAAVAGVSRTSFYAHFTGRDAVLHEVLLRRTVDVVEAANVVAAKCEHFDELCVAIFEHGFRTIRRDPVLARMLAGEGSEIGAGLATASDAFLQLVLEFWQPLVERAQDASEVRAELEPTEVTRWLLRVLLSFLGTASATVDEVRRSVEMFVIPALRTERQYLPDADVHAMSALRELEDHVAEMTRSLDSMKRTLNARIAGS
jgi:AcrR family transcriptional regulator